MESSVSQQNFVAGELSPNMRGRYELPVYQNGAEKFVNFIPFTQGPADFRQGSVFVINTRRNAVGRFIPFQFNDEQAYQLVFTEGYMRICRNNGYLVSSTKTITGATAANPVVVTSASHGFNNGDEVVITEVVGMTQLNNRSFIVTNKTANTFELYDNDGVAVDGSAFTAYASGGYADKIFEITTPYLEEYLDQIDYTQNADTMYLDHNYYEPRKLIRTAATSWSLSTYSRTSDPFLDKKLINAITLASPGEITTTAAHGYSTGQRIIIEGIVGTTELNGRIFDVVVTAVDKFTLKDLDGVAVDTSAYTAWSSGGYASLQELLPGAVAFYPGRLLHGYSDAYPESVWGSMALDSSGNPRYDNYSTGVDPDDGFKFTLAPTSGEVDKIQWLVTTSKHLAIGTFGGVSKADGGTDGAAIEPGSIAVKPLVNEGAAKMRPLFLGNSIMYFHRNSLTLYSVEFDVVYDSYNANDKNLVSEHITESGIAQMVYQNGRPPVIWCRRNDGILIGLTYQAKENVSGWHRHVIGGTNAKVISIGNMPRPNKYDQLWMIVERTIDGHTRRYIEYLSDRVIFPEKEEFFTGEENKDTDIETWRNAMFEKQKDYIYVDSAITYDGRDPGIDANATLTPGATSGTSVTFTASASVFKSTDVGRQLWREAQNGVGEGRAEIISYTSGTQVTCRILKTFTSTVAIPAGQWYITTDEVSGLWHLEGEEVTIIADGGAHDSETVADGIVSLDHQVSRCHVGLGYRGYFKTMAAEAGGVNGPAQGKPKLVNKLLIKFSNTLGAQYGKSLYEMESIPFRQAGDYTNRPPPVFSGFKDVLYEDELTLDKHLYIQQNKPLPCTVLCVIPVIETDND